jgi:GT2 family glycosyltransferase
MKDVNVSIVLYNTPISDIEKCLTSLASELVVNDITLIDNSFIPCFTLKNSNEIKIKYIHNPSNPGYGAAHNIALLESISGRSRLHLVMNADTYFSPGELTKMSRYMLANPKIGLLCPKVLFPDGRIQWLCKRVPTPFDLAVRALLPTNLRSKHNNWFELRASRYNHTMFVPYASGCFMLLSCDALRDVGVFDERFFMYPEDIDLSRRMAERYLNVFFPSATVYHRYGGESKKSMKMFLIHVKEIIKYFNKWGWVNDPNRKFINSKVDV